MRPANTYRNINLVPYSCSVEHRTFADVMTFFSIFVFFFCPSLDFEWHIGQLRT